MFFWLRAVKRWWDHQGCPGHVPSWRLCGRCCDRYRERRQSRDGRDHWSISPW